MPLRKLIAVLLILFPGMGFAAISEASVNGNISRLRERENWNVTSRESEFSTVAHTNRSGCESTRPPEAIATPSPLMGKSNVTVSFIVGTDGRVHSPFILESAGASDNQLVLDAVRAWRFRPATCNGVPTESEARIGFSGR